MSKFEPKYHSFKFTTSFTNKHSLTIIEMDGKELKGVTHAEVIYDPDEIPKVKLVMIPSEIDIEAEDLPFMEEDDDG